MKISQVAAQLYSVRDHLKTPADVAVSLRKLKTIGYEAVELAGIGPIEDAELRRMLDGEGFRCCSAHEPGEKLLADPARVADKLKRLGCPAVAYPYPAGVAFDTMGSVVSFAHSLNRAGKALDAVGVTLAYHNHQVEFRRINSRLILDVIYAETEPEYLKAELDTYWVQAGGADPVAWCRKMNRRLPLLHLKDFGVDDKNSPVFREIGQGNLGWPDIIQAAEASGCKWFIVEQDSGWAGNDPFASLATSFNYIKTNLCRQ